MTTKKNTKCGAAVDEMTELKFSIHSSLLVTPQTSSNCHVPNHTRLAASVPDLIWHHNCTATKIITYLLTYSMEQSPS